MGPGKDLKEHVIKADDVVLGDDALVLEAGGSVSVGCAETRPLGEPGCFGCDCEAPVKVGEEGREKGMSLFALLRSLAGRDEWISLEQEP